MMIIRDVKTTVLRIPYKVLPRMTADFDGQREFLLIEVETQSGVTGLGYIFLRKPGILTLRSCIEEMIAPLVIGRQATEAEAIWRDLFKQTYTTGRMGITMLAMSILDMALWDAVGRKTEMPLHRLWGHYRSEVPIYGSGCWRGLGGDGMAEKALGYVERGYKAIKMQAGHLYDMHTDVAHVRQMREAVGPGIDIMIDINMGWTADHTILTGRKFEEYDVYWIEEPVAAEDFAGYFRIADALDLRVVGGENHFTRYDMRPFFEHPKISILQPDVVRGGLTEMRKTAAIADTWGMAIAPHRYFEISLQVMASIPNGLILEHQDELDDLWVEPIEIRDGMAVAPERPGHGLRVRDEILQEFTVTA